MILQLALRNLKRNQRRTMLTVSSMIVSTALLILIHGVMSGMLDDIIASATEQYHGHIVVAQTSYHEDYNLFSTIPFNPETYSGIDKLPGTIGSSPRLRSFGLLSHEDSSSTVEILGVLADAENRVTSFDKHLTSGRYLSSEDHDGAIIGRSLANRLKVSVGDELIYLSQAADGSIGNALLTVRGVFTTLDQSYEDRLVLTNLQWLQDVMVMPARIHEISISLDDPKSADKVAQRLQKQLPQGWSASGWGQMIPEMKQVMQAFESSRIIVGVVFYLAAGLGVLNTFFMAVLERSREIGILLATGMSPWQVRRMVLSETFLVGLAGMLLGNILGLLMTLYMIYIGIDLSTYLAPVNYGGGTISPNLTATLELSNFLLPSVLLLVSCLFAGFVPANRAASLSPVQAIRGE